MIRPKKPAWEISVRHAGNKVLAVPLAAGVALIVWKLSIGIVAFLVTFVVLAVVFYSFLEWFSDRPDEIAKRVPTSSKELRRKTKQFFDNLPK
jgi:membrane protein implicated in regulation of membrane protease activity